MLEKAEIGIVDATVFYDEPEGWLVFGIGVGHV